MSVTLILLYLIIGAWFAFCGGAGEELSAEDPNYMAFLGVLIIFLWPFCLGIGMYLWIQERKKWGGNRVG